MNSNTAQGSWGLWRLTAVQLGMLGDSEAQYIKRHVQECFGAAARIEALVVSFVSTVWGLWDPYGRAWSFGRRVVRPNASILAIQLLQFDGSGQNRLRVQGFVCPPLPLLKSVLWALIWYIAGMHRGRVEGGARTKGQGKSA